MMERDDEPTQMRYAQALADWADAGGYEPETLWDVCTVAALGMPYEQAQWREVRTLSGGEQKRLVLEALLRGPDEVLLLDEPDNYLDVPAKRWLEEQLRRLAQDRAVRQPRPRAAGPGRDPDRHARAGRRGSTAVGARRRLRDLPRRPARTGFAGSRSCAGAGTRSTRSSRTLVLMYKTKAAYNDGLASALPGGADPAAQVRGGRAAGGAAAASRTSGCGCTAGAPASGR